MVEDEISGLLGKINFERLLGYTYGGLLLVFLGALVQGEIIQSTVEALGDFLAVLATFGIGAAIYVIHRYVIGELFLYPSLHLLHDTWDRKQERSGIDSTNTITFLQTLGVKRSECRAA